MQGLSFWRITGNNVANFLQGQLSADINQKNPGFCYCDRKGKVGCIGWVTLQDNEYWLCIPDINAKAMFTAWQPFAAFSQITQAPIEHLYPKLAGTQLLGISTNPSDDNWQAHALKHNIPIICNENRWQYTPHMLNVTAWTVDFNKGCYLGQEIIARTEHLGQVKRKLTTFINPENTAIACNTEIKDADANILGKVFFADTHLIQAIVPTSAAYYLNQTQLQLWDA